MISGMFMLCCYTVITLALVHVKVLVQEYRVPRGLGAGGHQRSGPSRGDLDQLLGQFESGPQRRT